MVSLFQGSEPELLPVPGKLLQRVDVNKKRRRRRGLQHVAESAAAALQSQLGNKSVYSQDELDQVLASIADIGLKLA